MRPVEHTNESIVAAGKAIQADGRNVTGFALRQVLGGGNHARLKQIWDAHLSEQAGAATEPVVALPPEVADEVTVVSQALAERLGALALGLNAKAVKAAERRVQEVMGVAAEQQSQANRELADAAQAVESLETEVEAAADRAQALQGRYDALQGEFQAQAIELAKVTERLAFAEVLALDTAKKHDAELDRVVETHTAFVAATESERVAHETQLAELRDSLHGAEMARDTERAVSAQLRNDMAALRVQLEVAEAARISQNAAMVKAEESRDVAVGVASRAREDESVLRGRLEATDAQLGALTKALGDSLGKSPVKAGAKTRARPAKRAAAASK